MCHNNICLDLVGSKLFLLSGFVGWMGFAVRKTSGIMAPYFPKKALT